MTKNRIRRREFIQKMGIGTAGLVLGCGSAPGPETTPPLNQISGGARASDPLDVTPAEIETDPILSLEGADGPRDLPPIEPASDGSSIGVGPKQPTSAVSTSERTDDAAPLSVLFITTDDLHYDSVGVCGCTVPDITPHIDRLASEGVRFEHAHVNIAVCQPCRGALATGLYPHRSGIMGFEHAKKDIPTVMQTLKDSGYLTGIMAKVTHSTPHGAFAWDMVKGGGQDTCNGREPTLYFKHTRQFIRRSQREKKPFYLMVNSRDPHRPFSGDAKEPRKFKECTPPSPSRIYRQDEIVVPGFLPDLEGVRRECAHYFSSVRRADDTVGEVLRALRESGEEEHTVVVFISDHGMSMPFSKGNCYPFSTRVPWIVRWPKVTIPGLVDRSHFISTIDFFPTLLEGLGLPVPEGLDGRSFLPLLIGEPQSGRDNVFTQFYRTVRNDEYPMRAVQDRRYSYIFNPWSDGKRRYRAEPLEGLAFQAMLTAGRTDEAIRRRVDMCLHREKEELYDLESDPNCLHNLAYDASRRDALEQMQETLHRWMQKTSDPALPCFENPENRRICGKLFSFKPKAGEEMKSEPD